MKKVLLTFLLLATCLAMAKAQVQVSGKVVSAVDNTPLPGVSVRVDGTTQGTVTNIDGEYSLQVPSNQTILVFSFIGYNNARVTVGNQNIINISLQEDVDQLEEVVVTGVAEGTSKTKLGFTVATVDEALLEEVPTGDPGNALRGKVPGVQIVQTSGAPGTSGSINLRGTTSISGSNQQPLIIIDGIITPPGSANLSDINMNDVETIEVIKGAAGASLYGSLAGNGVIQIVTKRGAKALNDTKVTVRNEYGVNDMLRSVPLSNSHAFLLDANGEYALDANGQRQNDPEQIFDNPYPGKVYDQQEEVFSGRDFYNNFISLASTQEKTNFYASFDNMLQKGLVEGQLPFERQSLRLNVDHFVNDRFKLGLTGSYINSSGANPQEGGQTGFIYGALLWEPDLNLRDPNPDGQPFNTVGRDIGNFSNANNPLYVAYNNQRNYERDRLLAGATASYRLNDWWRVEGQISLDRSNFQEDRFQDKDYLTQQNPNGNGGSIDKRVFISQARVANLSSYMNQTFGKVKADFTLRYITEEYLQDFQQTLGSNLISKGIFQLDNVDRSTLSSSSLNETFRAENYMANLRLDYDDKLILDGLYRIDRSSLFGADQRSKSFYRASLAYRLSQDVTIPGINEWKFRASIGTSGQRPPFEAQYETYTLLGPNLVPLILGNRNLRPSTIQEVEVGTDIGFLDRFSLNLTYAKANADDQILNVPLNGLTPFSSQYQNAGSIESTSYELGLTADVFKNDDFSWSTGFTASRSRAKITALNRPAYLLSAFNNTPLFNIEEGKELGAIYGNVVASSRAQLTVDENGFVNNLSGLATSLRPEDFVVNVDGYLIEDGTEFTENEKIYHLLDGSGNRLVQEIGNTNSDVLLGFTNNLSYKGFNLYFAMDAQLGGDIANVMRQNLIFNSRAGEIDQAGKPEGQRKYDTYYQSLSNSGNGLNQHLIESASYLAMRELALSYNFSSDMIDKLGPVGKVVRDAKLSLIGRNLFMITDYSGFTPDISSTGSVAAGNVDADVLQNPTIFRADVYGYPMFRSVSASLQFTF